MNVKKSLVVAGAVATVGVAGLTGLGVASAATATPATGEKSSLIDKIATRFNLNKEDVKAVFEEERSEHEAEHKQRIEARLSEAVSDGKLTEEQKQKIIAKQEELRAAMEAKAETLKDMTPEERRELKQQHADDLKAWAEENGIPEEYMHFKVMHGGGPVHMKLMDGPNEASN